MSAGQERDHVLRVAAVQLAYVPNSRIRQGEHWLPDEPILAFAAENPSAERVALSDEDLGEEYLALTDEALQAAKRERLKATDIKIKQVLEFCVREKVDVVVFPEASVPTELVHVLTGFKNEISIFAGIGQVREEDVDRLVGAGIVEARAALGCNAALFVSAETHRLVTKRDRAAAEDIVIGEGPARVQISKGRKRYEVGLTICMDYVNLRRDFDDSGDLPYVVLVSALTRPTDDFIKNPRNFATVFANDARNGGSAILAPDMGGLFVDLKLGTDPLPPGEAIVAADYSGHPTTPSSTRPPENRAVLRAALLYEESESPDEAGTAAGIAAQIALWRLDHYRAGKYSDFLKTATTRLDSPESTDSTTLSASMKRLRMRQRQAQSLLQADLDLLVRHLVIEGAQSHSELIYSAHTLLHDGWHTLLSRTGVVGLGRLIDIVNENRRSLESKVRTRYRRITPPSRSSDKHATSDGHPERTVVYSARLGKFDSDKAVQSLPRQLGVLRSVAMAGDDSLSILYRLSTVRQTSGNLAPLFDVLALTEASDPSLIEDLSEGVGQQLGVAFSGAWDTTPTSADPVLRGAFVAELRPISPSPTPIQEDWSGLIDYVRSLAPQVVVQLACRRAEPARSINLPPGQSISEPIGMLSENERDAAAFLSRASFEEAGAEANLVLQVHVASADPVGQAVLQAIGLWLFKGTSFEILLGEHAEKSLYRGPENGDSYLPMTPAQMLRIFHPPYGLIEGRGLERSRPRDLLLPGISLPTEGVSLGFARSAHGREDKRVDVRLDNKTRLRHTYVVGRTGSGKTNLLKLMARQDIEEGSPIVVIDPHGDLVDYLLRHLSGREDEVVLLDFGDPDHLPVLNPLDLDVRSASDLQLNIEDLIQILVRQSFHEFYGPRFEEIVRLALESITHSRYPIKPPGVLDLVRLLRSKSRRQWIANILEDSDLKERWAVFEQQSSSEIGQVLHWALSKFSEIQKDGVLGQVLAGGSSTISIKDCIRDGGILLVKIPEWEMSTSAAGLLGAFIQERVRKAVYGRLRTGGDVTNKPVFMYVDEFQTFAVSGFDDLVAEARKFGLGLTLAHQNVGQLKAFSRFTGTHSDGLLASILGNIASRIVFGVSSRDAVLLQDELDISADRLRAPGNYQATAQILIDGESHTFTLVPPNADSDTGLPVDRDLVRRRMVVSGSWRRRSELVAEDEDREQRLKSLIRDHHSNRQRVTPATPTIERAPRSPWRDSGGDEDLEPDVLEMIDSDVRNGQLQRLAGSWRGLLEWSRMNGVNADVQLGSLSKGAAPTPDVESSIELALAVRAESVASEQLTDRRPPGSSKNRRITLRILEEAGLGRLSAHAQASLLRRLNSELQQRVGSVIFDDLSPDQVAEFERLFENGDDAASARFLDTVRSDISEVVKAEHERLIREIHSRASEILEEYNGE